MINLDNAATSCPKPECVTNAVVNALRNACGNPGRGSHRLSRAAADIVFDCREAVARHFGAKTECVVFTYNCTYALNQTIKAFARRGAVLISDLEHNSVIRPCYSLKKSGIRTDFFRASNDPAELARAINDSVRADTALLVSTLASNVCGLRPDAAVLGAAASKRGMLLVCDAAQFAGSGRVDINASGIDALCAPGHKGLYGPCGVGFTVFADKYADIAASLPTLIEGGSGTASEEREMPDVLPERFEAGTQAVPAIAGLAAGIRYVERIGTDTIYKHECGLRSRLRDMLGGLSGVTIYGDEYGGNILLFNLDGLPSGEVSARLDRIGICTRSGLHCAPTAHDRLKTGGGAVRLSFGVHNDVRELETVYKAIKASREI